MRRRKDNLPSILRRREFLKLAGGAVIASATLPLHARNPDEQLEAEDSPAPPVASAKSPSQIRVLMHEADGSPLASECAHTLIARHMAGDPLPQPMVSAEGRTRITLASEPIQLGLRLKIPGFGEVFCYADNNGAGYSKPGQIEFVVAAAQTRLRRVREKADAAKKLGVPADPEFDRLLEAASHPLPTRAGPEQIAAAYQTLAQGLHAGERVALSIARHRIATLSRPRSEFLFGCLAADWQHGPEYQKLLTSLFNFGVLSWYSWSQNPEPIEQRIDYGRQDRSLEWCLSKSMVPKGFGYVYLTNGATPAWFRQWSYEKVLPEYKRIVAQTTRRYGTRLPYVEVINEAHDKANIFRFSHPQILELTREACRAAREGSPTVKRVINHCCLWAEYARGPGPSGIRRWSPYRYLRDCVSNGTEFEVVGLQLYYPQHDLLEIDRMLDRFKAFNRPVHISELSCNSADGLDPLSMRPKSPVPGWHGPWNESMQADWLEAIYTLCYSKPEFEAVGWWNVADFDGHFWPYGGLLRKDLSPKEGYLRLQKLQQQWGVAKTS